MIIIIDFYYFHVDFNGNTVFVVMNKNIGAVDDHSSCYDSEAVSKPVGLLVLKIYIMNRVNHGWIKIVHDFCVIVINNQV